MARKSFSVLFFIKKGKLLKNGEAPVCMRIRKYGYVMPPFCPITGKKHYLCIQ